MNKDRIKPILDKLKIKPTDNWITIHKYPNRKPDNCYYYTFNHKGTTYCVSGDSISLVLSDEKDNYYYMGFKESELIEAINKILKRSWNNDKEAWWYDY